MAIIKGTAKSEKLTGTLKDDTMRGFAGNDTLNGSNGNDVLDGGKGDDRMAGGNGNDDYLVDSLKDIVTETVKGGIDTVETSVTNYKLGNYVENLVLAGKTIQGTGNKLNNIITGNAANNVLKGDAGDDTLVGGAGNDNLDGGMGADTALFNNPQTAYTFSTRVDANKKTQIIVQALDGKDSLSNVEFLQFSDGNIISAADIISGKFFEPATPPIIVIEPPVEPVPPITTPLHFEKTAPIVYQTDNVNQLDSITTLLSYLPKVTNGVNYQNFDPQQWRPRPSSEEFALDLTQTSTTTNQVVLKGSLDAKSTTETWFKINLTQAGTLHLQDLSDAADVIEAAVFDSNNNGEWYSVSAFDSREQLNRYDTLSAGDYFVRISKNTALKSDARLNTAVDFKVLLNTETSSDFVLPALQADMEKFTLHAEFLPNQNSVFYKFKVNTPTEFTLDTTKFIGQFDIGLYQPASNGDLNGVRYSFFNNATAQHIYDLNADSYYLSVDALKVSNQAKTLDIPFSAKNTLNFDTTFLSTAPNILKADSEHPKQALTRDSDGNLELTYSFDFNKIPNAAEDARPNPTLFNDAQQAAARLAFQEYANVAKLKFREIPSDSPEKANLTFINVSTLGDSAGDTLSSTSSTNDFRTALIRLDASDENNYVPQIGNSGYTTLLHEIGHALGLKHPQQYASGGVSDAPYLLDAKDNAEFTLMSYNPHPYPQKDGSLFYTNSGSMSAKTPLLYDMAAIQMLYGANTNYNANNNVYNWKTDVDPYSTLWDGGGVDTIDVSNQNQPQVIDLRAGQFSSLGAVAIMYSDNSIEFNPPKENLSIAYGSIIENAIGGSGDDALVGNSVVNQLTGNTGNDNFVFAAPLSDFNIDTITDFKSAEDKLTLDRSIFSGLNLSNQLKAEEFFIGNHVSQAENALQRIIFDTLTHGLYYDSDGTGGNNAVEFAILANVSQLNVGQIFIQG